MSDHRSTRKRLRTPDAVVISPPDRVTGLAISKTAPDPDYDDLERQQDIIAQYREYLKETRTRVAARREELLQIHANYAPRALLDDEAALMLEGVALELERLRMVEARMPLTIEQLNERYRRLTKVGEGTFGEVYIVYDTHTKTCVSMKRVKKLLHAGPKSRGGLTRPNVRELFLLHHLQHKNVAHLLDSMILEDGSCVFFMPLFANDLTALMRLYCSKGHRAAVAAASSTSTTDDKRRPRLLYGLPVPLVKHITMQLLEALVYLHGCEVLHRDIKPSNIMLDHDGTIKLIDMGWSRHRPMMRSADAADGMLTPACSVAYRPPDGLIGSHNGRKYDTPLDMWSVGCVVFEMLCHERFSYDDDDGSNALKSFQCALARLGPPPVSFEEQCVKFVSDSKTRSDVEFHIQASRAKLNRNNTATTSIKPTTTTGGGDSIVDRSLEGTLRLALLGYGRDDEVGLVRGAADFLKGILQWTPSDRLSAEEALRHPWLAVEEPRPSVGDLDLAINRYRSLIA